MITECKANSIQCFISNTFLSVNSYSGYGNFFYDLPNFILSTLIIFFLCKKYKIPQVFFCILILHMTLPLFLNGVIFPPDYMEDQFRYFNGAVQFRSANLYFEESITVYFASLLLALVPVPFLFSVVSIGIINKNLFAFLFIYLYKKNLLTRWSAWFYLLYPSFALYSGLALRDTLIFLFMIIPSFMLIKNRIFLAFILALPLFILKFPIAPILYLTFIGYLFCMKKIDVFSKKRLVFYFMCLFSIYIIVAPAVLDALNLYRMAMYFEDNGTTDGIVMLTGLYDLTLNIINGLGSAFLSPSPLNSSGFQFIQSIENIFIFAFLIGIVFKNFNQHTQGRLLFWLVSFLAIISIYSLVVFNLGTFSRYKFPMIAWFVILVSYEIKRTEHPTKPESVKK